MIIRNRTFFISAHVSDYYRCRFAREILQRGGFLCMDESEKPDCVIFEAQWEKTGTSISKRDDQTLYITVREMIRFLDSAPLFQREEFIVHNGVLHKWICEESKDGILVIPNGVITIAPDAFGPSYPCQESLYRKAKKGIYKIVFPKSLEVIAKDAFRGFGSLRRVSFREGLKEIGGFRGCRALNEISIPKSCEKIGDYAFSGCKSLETIEWNQKVKVIGRHAFNGVKCEAFASWPALETIGEYAFANTRRLKTVTLENESMECGRHAFAKSALTSLMIHSPSCTLESGCFTECGKLNEIQIEGKAHIRPLTFPFSVMEGWMKMMREESLNGDIEAMLKEMMLRYSRGFLKKLPLETYLEYEDVIEKLTPEKGKDTENKPEPYQKEALIRLRLLIEETGLNPHVAKYYKEGKLYYSYLTAGGFMGSIDTISYDPRYGKIVEDAERMYGIHVYHCVESLEPWESLALLYVEKDPSEWKYNRPSEGTMIAYVYNFELGEGEFGMTGFEAYQGALVRTA